MNVASPMGAGIEEVDAVISTIGGSVANPLADSEVRTAQRQACKLIRILGMRVRLMGSLIVYPKFVTEFC